MLGPCKGFILAYLDDIIVYSKAWEEHLLHLGQVFRRLQEAGLRVNPKKSKPGFKELDYLGYTIGDDRVRPQQKKIDVITKAIPPRTKKCLQQFLGLVGYYSRFIQNYATLAMPLTDRLTK